MVNQTINEQEAGNSQMMMSPSFFLDILLNPGRGKYIPPKCWSAFSGLHGIHQHI
jgi:hypothetical protein